MPKNVTTIEFVNVGIKQAKTDLSKLITQAKQGKRIYLTNQGKRVAELVAVAEESVADKRGLGMFKHKINLPPGWNTQKARRQATKELLDLMDIPG